MPSDQFLASMFAQNQTQKCNIKYDLHIFQFIAMQATRKNPATNQLFVPTSLKTITN